MDAYTFIQIWSTVAESKSRIYTVTYVESRRFNLPERRMLAADQRVTANDHRSERPLKICLLGYRSNPFSGGQGIYIKYLSKAMVEAGHQVDVISGEPYPELDVRVGLIKLPGLNLYKAKNPATAIRPKHLLSYTDFFEWLSMLTGGFSEPYTFGRRLVAYFKSHCPDYDIVHDNQSLSFGTLKLQDMGVPILTTIHHPVTRDLRIALANEDSWYLRLLIRRWHSFLRMQKKVVKKLNHLVTVSEASRKDIAKDFLVPESKITVVNNGIDTNVFKPINDITREPCTIMVTASADVPMKGLAYMLRSAAELKDEVPELKLIILGRLKQNGNTAKLIYELGIGDLITFYSDLSSYKIAELYARATCAVVPSIYEGFGLPAGEAMACSVPVITTDGGALPEVVGDSGLIVPARNHHAISNALRRLLQDGDLRITLGKKGMARIHKHFSWEVAAEKMVDIYRSIIKEQQ